MISADLIAFAHHLADISEPIAQKYFRVNNGEVAKEDDSPVTKADREIEKVMREAIEEKFPDHGIIGEEFGNKNIDAEYVWVLDPIDGTSSFIIGRAIFGTLIALIHNKKPVLGIMNQPIAKERWIGVNNQGSFFISAAGTKKITTRNCQEISDAVMCSASSFYFQNGEEKVLQDLSSLTKYQKIGGVIYGGDCYSYASLASGFVDIVIDTGLKIYDYAALIPIIENAGGVVSNWQGNDLELKSDVQFIACANKELHRKILEIIG